MMFLTAYTCLVAATVVGSGHAASDASDLYFFEGFDQEAPKTDVFSVGKWSYSEVEKYSGQKIIVMPSDSAPMELVDDKGLLLAQDNRHYGFGTMFSKPIVPADGKEIVIQYGRIDCCLDSST